MTPNDRDPVDLLELLLAETRRNARISEQAAGLLRELQRDGSVELLRQIAEQMRRETKTPEDASSLLREMARSGQLTNVINFRRAEQERGQEETAYEMAHSPPVPESIRRGERPADADYTSHLDGAFDSISDGLSLDGIPAFDVVAPSLSDVETVETGAGSSFESIDPEDPLASLLSDLENLSQAIVQPAGEPSVPSDGPVSLAGDTAAGSVFPAASAADFALPADLLLETFGEVASAAEGVAGAMDSLAEDVGRFADIVSGSTTADEFAPPVQVMQSMEGAVPLVGSPEIDTPVDTSPSLDPLALREEGDAAAAVPTS